MKPLSEVEQKEYKRLFNACSPSELGLTPKQFYDTGKLLNRYPPEEVFKVIKSTIEKYQRHMVMESEKAEEARLQSIVNNDVRRKQSKFKRGILRFMSESAEARYYASGDNIEKTKCKIKSKPTNLNPEMLKNVKRSSTEQRYSPAQKPSSRLVVKKSFYNKPIVAAKRKQNCKMFGSNPNKTKCTKCRQITNVNESSSVCAKEKSKTMFISRYTPISALKQFPPGTIVELID